MVFSDELLDFAAGLAADGTHASCGKGPRSGHSVGILDLQLRVPNAANHSRARIEALGQRSTVDNCSLDLLGLCSDCPRSAIVQLAVDDELLYLLGRREAAIEDWVGHRGRQCKASSAGDRRCTCTWAAVLRIQLCVANPSDHGRAWIDTLGQRTTVNDNSLDVRRLGPEVLRGGHVQAVICDEILYLGRGGRTAAAAVGHRQPGRLAARRRGGEARRRRHAAISLLRGHGRVHAGVAGIARVARIGRIAGSCVGLCSLLLLLGRHVGHHGIVAGHLHTLLLVVAHHVHLAHLAWHSASSVGVHAIGKPSWVCRCGRSGGCRSRRSSSEPGGHGGACAVLGCQLGVPDAADDGRARVCALCERATIDDVSLDGRGLGAKVLRGALVQSIVCDELVHLLRRYRRWACVWERTRDLHLRVTDATDEC
mmetsp:Transcript_131008/g.339288  ORF Transcript_131008/g.339288 Transcript_131008/m.339288 type:complete len:425 (-) Transcript_131008:223-1497(-)